MRAERRNRRRREGAQIALRSSLHAPTVCEIAWRPGCIRRRSRWHDVELAAVCAESRIDILWIGLSAAGRTGSGVRNARLTEAAIMEPSGSRNAIGIRPEHVRAIVLNAKVVREDRRGLLQHNGPTLNGRPGTDQLSNHKDRSAGPVHSSGWLSDAAGRPRAWHFVTGRRRKQPGADCRVLKAGVPLTVHAHRAALGDEAPRKVGSTRGRNTRAAPAGRERPTSQAIETLLVSPIVPCQTQASWLLEQPMQAVASRRIDDPC